MGPDSLIGSNLTESSLSDLAETPLIILIFNAVARLVLDGGYSKKGISPPEFVGRADGCRVRVEKYLGDRGVHYRLEGP